MQNKLAALILEKRQITFCSQIKMQLVIYPGPVLPPTGCWSPIGEDEIVHHQFFNRQSAFELVRRHPAVF